jgi:glycerophosphoryl diester phosphodiesterase
MPTNRISRYRFLIVTTACGALLLGIGVAATATTSHATASTEDSRDQGHDDARRCPRDRIELLAHRGTGPGTRSVAGHAYTEDTVPAFEAAMAHGADGFETDYWPTRDEHIVSLHDAALDRTTDGSGPVGSRRWSYVRKLVTDSGAGVPTVTTVESGMARFGGLRQQEIKRGAYFSDHLLRRLLALDRRYIAPENLLITSSELQTLRRTHEIDPAIGIGYIVRSNIGRPDLAQLPTWVDVALIDLRAVDRTTVDRVHAAGHLLSVRGVDNIAQLHRAVAMGVDRVVTDHPERLGRVC